MVEGKKIKVDSKKKTQAKKREAEPATRLKTRWSGRAVEIHRSKGSIPDALKGTFTDIAMAERAIDVFYSQAIR